MAINTKNSTAIKSIIEQLTPDDKARVKTIQDKRHILYEDALIAYLVEKGFIKERKP